MTSQSLMTSELLPIPTKLGVLIVNPAPGEGVIIEASYKRVDKKSKYCLHLKGQGIQMLDTGDGVIDRG
jgi:hypothetical protein